MLSVSCLLGLSFERGDLLLKPGYESCGCIGKDGECLLLELVVGILNKQSVLVGWVVFLEVSFYEVGHGSGDGVDHLLYFSLVLYHSY